MYMLGFIEVVHRICKRGDTQSYFGLKTLNNMIYGTPFHDII